MLTSIMRSLRKREAGEMRYIVECDVDVLILRSSIGCSRGRLPDRASIPFLLGGRTASTKVRPYERIVEFCSQIT